MSRFCFLLAITVLFISGCDKSDDLYKDMYIELYHMPPLECETVQVEGEVNDIIGKWKLVRYFTGKDSFDYSCATIIYTFKEDNMVTIESDVPSFKGGKEYYSYSYYPFCPACFAVDPDENFKFGKNKYFCTVEETEMRIYFSIRKEGMGRTLGRIDKVLHRIE